jgi:hypothetical protein
MSTTRSFGQGPVHGLGHDALSGLTPNGTTTWWSYLDARGSARLDLPPGSLPPGLQLDLVFGLQDSAGVFTSLTKVLEFDT